MSADVCSSTDLGRARAVDAEQLLSCDGSGPSSRDHPTRLLRGRADTSLRCRSAFFVFCSEYRPSVKQQYPGLSIGDCAKKLGEMWSKLSQSEKQPYEEKAQKLREKYDRVRGRRHGDAVDARVRPADCVSRVCV